MRRRAVGTSGGSRPTRARTRLAAALILLAGAVPAVLLRSAAPAQASFGISAHMGWDACGASVSKAQAFWSGTPYYNMGMYLGGAGYGAGCKRWTNSEVSQLLGQGWQFLPIWVGPQAPCSNQSVKMSSNTATAASQGQDEAQAIYNKIVSLGWDTSNTPITYDLEAFDTSNSGCMAAVKAFLNQFVAWMHVPPAQKAGVYGSTCGSGLSAYATLANVPDYITGAAWNGIKSTTNMPCISSTYWANQQRHKQYRGGHNETWNGVTMNVDSDCSNGPVYPPPDKTANTQGCI